MKCTRTLKNGLIFEIDADTEVDLFRQIAKLEETFGEVSCGACSKTNIKPQVRNVTTGEGKAMEEFEYFEMRCLDCGAALSYGLHKKGGTMFPHRKDENGKYDPKQRGWKKFVVKPQAEGSNY